MSMNPIIYLLVMILDLYNFILLIWVILSWLIAFNIINRYQPLVARLSDMLYRLTEPVLRPIRRYLPRTTIDIAPIILLIGIHFIKYTLVWANMRLGW